MRRARAGAMLAIALVLVAAAAVAYRLRGPMLDGLSPEWYLRLAQWRYGLDVTPRVDLAMPDGTKLAATLVLPKGKPPWPTVLVQVPYGRVAYGESRRAGVLFPREGFATLLLDVRGTGQSGGELLPWRDVERDAAATLDWIVAQPWSNGRVGTYGCSALGETQFVLGRRGHPAHRAMVPLGAGGVAGRLADRHAYFGFYEGGVFQLASGFGWYVWSGVQRPDAPPPKRFDVRQHLRELPVIDLVQRVRPAPNGYEPFLAMPLGDPRWSAWGFLDENDRGRVPALVMNNWGDQTVADTLALAEAWRRDPAYAPRQKVFIGPGNHCDSWMGRDRFGELPLRVPPMPQDALALQWFDALLRDRPGTLAKAPPYTFYQLVEDRWLTADAWPPKEATARRWHLASGGHANSRRGDGRLQRDAPAAAAADTWRSDPADPVPSRGGPICCTGNPAELAGPVDQAEVEARDDVLVYTSEPLSQPLRIAGPLHATLTVSSTAPDTDLVARLVDVFPDGRALNIQEGALRLRYREGFTRPAFLRAGERVTAVVDMRAIAWTVAPGHRLRLQVASSSFPRLERNLQTGAAENARETRIVSAMNTLHHGAGAPAFVELYALPLDAGSSAPVAR